MKQDDNWTVLIEILSKYQLNSIEAAIGIYTYLLQCSKEEQLIKDLDDYIVNQSDK